MAQRSDELPTGGPLEGLLVFLVWVAAFPTMLDHVDRRFRRRASRLGPGDELEQDPFVEVRQFGGIVWDAGVFDVIGAVLAALQWRDAFRNPFWGGGLGWPLATWCRR